MAKRSKRGLGDTTMAAQDIACRRYLRARMRSIKPPAGYRLIMYALKERPAVSEATATKCGRYGIGLERR